MRRAFAGPADNDASQMSQPLLLLTFTHSNDSVQEATESRGP